MIRCLNCRRELADESELRDAYCFGSWSEPCHVVPDGGCVRCAPGPGDEIDLRERDEDAA